jgi:2-keto-4-pentenoate hydratase
MQAKEIHAAASLLAKSRLQGRFLNELPADARPTTFADAAAIQNETAKILGEEIIAYKVSGVDPETVIWGGILASRFLAHPAQLPASAVPLLGVEGEIAYRLNVDLEPSHRTLTLEQFDEITTVVPTIEVVDTRFLSYADAPAMDRNADFMSNGALVYGDPWPNSKATDFTKLPITLSSSGAVLSETAGGHSAIDSRLPALAFFRSRHRPDHVPRGTIITTGTYTGLQFVKPGDTVSIAFAGYGSLEIAFTV